MTEKIYYKDPYLKECEAQVIDVIKKEESTIAVLDKTPFYPEGGGQPSDTGTINGVKVLYVYEKDDVIYHEMEREIKVGEAICKVDFERRFDLMQQHSGEHLVSGVIYSLYKGNNKGFHMGEDYITMDIDIYPITSLMIDKIEEKVNEYIYMNEPFRTYIVNKESLESVPSRKKIDVDGDIRIVEAKDMDCCPCCGTHVLRTGEIGIVKILKVEKYKKMSRIYLKCGKRAYEDLKIKHNIVTTLSRNFSTDEHDLIKSIEKKTQELLNLKKEVKELNVKIAKEEALKLMNDSSLDFVFKEYEDKDFNCVKLIGEALNEKEYMYVLTSLKDKNILFANNTSRELNCGKIFKENIKKFNGKGGGRGESAQGSFESLQDLEQFYTFLCEVAESENK